MLFCKKIIGFIFVFLFAILITAYFYGCQEVYLAEDDSYAQEESRIDSTTAAAPQPVKAEKSDSLASDIPSAKSSEVDTSAKLLQVSKTADTTSLIFPAEADSTTDSLREAVLDTSLMDSLKVDSTMLDSLTQKKTSDIDTIITYSADSIYFGVGKRTTILYKNAVVQYQKMKLTAGKITVSWDENLLNAVPIQDTIRIDTTVVTYDTLGLAPKSDSSKSSSANPLKIESTDSLKTPSVKAEKALWDTTEIHLLNYEDDLDSAQIQNLPRKLTIVRSDTFRILTFNEDSTGTVYILVTIDSTRIVGVDTIMTVGYPVFNQDGDVIRGERMTYNLKSKKGYVFQGDTDYGDGYYHGKDIKRVDDKVLNVGTGYYTTCDADTPHYHFFGNEMKLMVKDKVVTKPVVLYFGEVPVMIVPFAMFSSKSGRHSGLIMPSYGESGANGRYFNNLGYFWAPSDYWDARVGMNYYDKSDKVIFHGISRYAVRYRLNGTVAGSYTRLSGFREWDLRFDHRQTTTPNSTLNVNGNFVSSPGYYTAISSNPYDRMNRELHSGLNFTHRPTFFNGSYTVNANYDEYLDSGTYTANLPRFSITFGQKSFIPISKDQEKSRWYNQIYYSARSSFNNQDKKTMSTSSVTIETPDSTYSTVDTSYTVNKSSALKNGYTLSAKQDLFKYFSINSSMGINQDVTDERRYFYYDVESDSIKFRKENGIFARHTYNLGTGLSTKIYGLFPVNMGKITSIRHVMTPSVSYRFTPDFSEEQWGYYRYLTTTSGIVNKYDTFAGQPLFGNTPAGKSKNMSFSVNNLFQMKREYLKDDKEQVDKFDLFSLNLSSSYDFEKDSLNFSNLVTSFSANPIKSTPIGPVKYLDLDLRTQHSFYSTNSSGGAIDRYYFEGGNLEKGKLLRLTSASLKTTIKFSAIAKKDKKSKKTEEPESDEFLTPTAPQDEEDVGFSDDFSTMDLDNRFQRNMDYRPQDIPWDISTTFNMSWTRNNPFAPATKSAWIQNTVQVNLTPNFSLNYSQKIDLVTREVTLSSFNFYRDLHCWDARFSWYPSGVNPGFNLLISVKSPSLRDLKLEKARNRGSLFNF